ncbi:MAG: MBL fold metallo-hydrolase [Brevinematia bacterium]
MADIVRVSYLGHACVLVETQKGTRILMDPFDKSVGYNATPVECNVITISHEHFDHSNVRMGLGMPKVFRGVNGGSWVGVDTTYMGIRIYNVSVYHDDEMGRIRGKNSIFVFEFHDTTIPIRMSHLGDLGHNLKPEDLTRIGKIDILFIPIGGYFTIDYKIASEIVTNISPHVIIPIHYKTEVTRSWEIDNPEKFLSNFKEVRYVKDWNYTFSESDLEGDKIIFFMDYRP